MPLVFPPKWLPRTPPSSTVDEVVVTATKIERPARYVTDSVTVITAEEIRERNFTDTTEILRQTAGIAFKQAGGPGQFNYPKVRGFGAGHFLVVVDGVKINEGLFPGVGNFIGQIDPKLIERIEILRGPQADLYGSDSTAGVIAITTKEPLPGTNTTLGGRAWFPRLEERLWLPARYHGRFRLLGKRRLHR